MSRKIGPNVRKLICTWTSTLAVPPGGGLPDAFAAITTPGKMAKLVKKATERTFEALDAVKAARDNPHGDDDEAIAADILDRIEAAKKPAFRRK